MCWLPLSLGANVVLGVIAAILGFLTLLCYIAIGGVLLFDCGSCAKSSPDAKHHEVEATTTYFTDSKGNPYHYQKNLAYERMQILKDEIQVLLKNINHEQIMSHNVTKATADMANQVGKKIP